MIEHYRDLAANERMYLAWVRTGITVMVLGFVVQKFEIFLASLKGLLIDQEYKIEVSATAEYDSVALVALGILVIVAGTLRFFRVKAELNTTEVVHFRGTLLVLTLTCAIVAFGMYLVGYMTHLI